VRKYTLCFLFLIISIPLSFHPFKAQNAYTPSEENLENREWFRDAKFGMFIHWGIYSVLGDGEWVMENKRIDKKTYKHLAEFFNPVDFDPEEWVSLAKAAGMKYITFTARHHDGFSMFNTSHSDWNVVQRTHYKNDILKKLADECRRQGIKLFLYYSHLDWYHEDYYPLGRTGHYAGRPDSGDWDKYLDFINAQLTELLTNYGKIAGIWFDGMWDKRDTDWKLDDTYNLIHSMQPQTLIGNNHHTQPAAGEDIQIFERDLPGQNITGYREETETGMLPLETCETMNNSWGFNLFDKNFKSTKEIIQYLVRAAGFDGNLLLNVGPMPNGRIQPESVAILKEIGEWMDKNGGTIYGTRGGPIASKVWGVTTQKGDRVFVHNLSGETHLLIPNFGKTIRRISLFTDSTILNFKQDEFGISIQIPLEKINEINTIIVLET
jgi:alpha-L-fucosidase